MLEAVVGEFSYEWSACEQDGTISPPTFLEEGYVGAEEKRRLWPFGNDRGDDGGKFKRGIE